jgi:DNA-binding MarR family transcriptional regulator
VGRLVERGLVRRRRSTADARRLEVTLTRAGRVLAARAPAAVQGRLISGLERLDPGDRRVLARTLGCLLVEMGIGEEAATMFFEE